MEGGAALRGCTQLDCDPTDRDAEGLLESQHENADERMGSGWRCAAVSRGSPPDGASIARENLDSLSR